MQKFLVNMVSGLIFSKEKRQRFRNKFQSANLMGHTLKGMNNEIFLVKKDGGLKKISKFTYLGVELIVKGNNNKVYIADDIKIFDSKIEIHGNNCEIEIKDTPHVIRDVKVKLMHDKSSLKIGNDFACNEAEFIVGGKSIIIGNDCMFSWNIFFMNNDYHTIVDKNTDEILNPPKDIIIGNHVWVGNGVSVLKGAKIGNDSIVGSRSVVTKSFEEDNLIVAGMPAKIVKKDINWKREPNF
ncbi:MAG: Galactoside O-acetyltransferase [Alphaproteobacteria bacterium ADurb.Bin438]|nr:MAG: Galactoside O-acetyltransferase [Alphaproteobacteria bacterium ADurb.Bin438]